MSLARALVRLLVLLSLVLGAPAIARERPQGEHERGKSRAASSGARTTLEPYVELGQLVFAELEPGDEVLTYTTVAAGLDAAIAGRNTRGAVSVRYERRFGWGDDAGDGDVISGLARVSSAVIPGTLNLEAGALAARTRVEGSGGLSLNPSIFNEDATSQIYALYAGPTLTTRAGAVALSAAYRIGYTRVESPDALLLAPGQPAVDVFDESLSQAATVSAGVRPGELAPFGVTASAGWLREDISNLDQRVDDRFVRGDVVLPVSLDLALLAGVGYEDVEVSSRDAVRDAAGNPVIGRDGRFVTDDAAPRRLAYDVDGLIWDAGVLWRPSPRTALEAHVGRRYGSTSVYGSFAYAPSPRSSLNVSVYDNVTGFGGAVRRALEDLPTDFEASRNPLSGDLNGCIVARSDGACLNNALSSVAAATFRGRGVMATYARKLGRLAAGVGAGYDRRRFLAAPGTVLAAADGVIDESWWASGYLTGRIDARSSFAATAYANWFQSGLSRAGDATALGANASYFRALTDRLTATAAIGVDGIERDAPLPDQWGATALVGLRYSLGRRD